MSKEKPIEDYPKYEINNEINLTLEVNEKYINENIYFFNKDNDNRNDEKYKKSIKYYNKLLNESKVDIFINNEKYENKRYFKPKEKGEYKIK